jgi:hypothetical protein
VESADTLYEAVKKLQSRYGSTLDNDTQCKDIWFMALKHLRSEIVKAGGTHKPDREIIAYIIAKAHNLYQTATEVITTIDTTEVDALSKVRKHYVIFLEMTRES